MHKLVLNVAAFLVFVALVILAQAPDAAPVAKAPTGPDAVAANIVNTVCASCILMGYIHVDVCV